MSLAPNLPIVTPTPKKRWRILFILGPILAFGIWWGANTIVNRLAFQVTGKILYQCYPQICTVNADGSGKTQLTFQPTPISNSKVKHKTIDNDPSWSPDGKQIVFSRSFLLEGQIYKYHALFIMNSDGSRLRQIITKEAVDATNPNWSHDGKKITFINQRSYDGISIVTINTDGSVLNSVPLSENLSKPILSPDRQYIIFTETFVDAYTPPPKDSLSSDGSYPTYIYITDANGSNRRRLTDFSSYTPAWSPDGKKIAFSAIQSNGKDGIWTINPDGSDLKQLTRRGVSPAWSANGEYIVYVNNTIYLLCPPPLCPASGLTIIKSDGSKEIPITNEVLNSSPSWQPIP